MGRPINNRNGQVVRGRGRPRLDQPNRRVECMVPPQVYDQLVKAEAATGIYRTRMAAAVLSEWAASTHYPQQPLQ
jgi:hypothetical protein